MPAIQKHRNALLQVVVTSFFCFNCWGLFNPLLIQQIIDAVISQGNFSSLNVLGTLAGGDGLSPGASRITPHLPVFRHHQPD